MAPLTILPMAMPGHADCPESSFARVDDPPLEVPGTHFIGALIIPMVVPYSWSRWLPLVCTGMELLSPQQRYSLLLLEVRAEMNPTYISSLRTGVESSFLEIP